MKKAKLLVLLILSIFMYSVSVWAEEDVWKPDEVFFTEHDAECIVEGHEYYANGPDGQVFLYENPVTPEVIDTIENGEIILIEYVYTNEKGITWGFCESFEGYGWIPMPYMVKVYDYTDFEAEYGEQFLIERGDVVDEDLDGDFLFRSSRCMKFWTYPGSSRGYTMLIAQHGMNMPKYTKKFVDEDGRTWGFIEYFSSEYTNRWVCMDGIFEMTADFEELYPDGNAPVRDKREITPYEGEEIVPEPSEAYLQAEKIEQQEEAKELGIQVGILVLAAAAILNALIMLIKIGMA